MQSSTAATANLDAGIRPHPIGVEDRYCGVLCFVLIGYATLGKGVAYIGVPPLFIGEIVMLFGLVLALRSGSGIALLASPASVMLLLLFSWIVLRTVPFVGSHGLTAVRDSVVVTYGMFAFIVGAVLLHRPDRLRRVLLVYSRFAYTYGLIAAVIVTLPAILDTRMPNWPVSGIPLINLRLGECASHLAGAGAFGILGLMRTGRIWPAVMIGTLGVIAVSRGAMLAFVLPCLFAFVMTRQKRRIAPVLLFGVALFGITYAIDLNVPLPGGRSFGPSQIVKGFESIVGKSDAANLDGTKMWRLNWWDAIVNYTFHGPYFWGGKGFGMNLSEEDGFAGTELEGPPLRSPHNAHMTLLARSGVPGLLLWFTTLAVWFGMLFSAAFLARRRGDFSWADIFVWLACYCAAILINASFDVALEGPMLGIWFWCLFGLGIAATIIYRAEVAGARRQFGAGTSRA